jgi:hypothetical protein
LAGVVAAAGALTINLVFDFRGGSKEITTITAEYTFDHAVPQIRQWMYARSLGDRYAIEVLANDTALQADPHILEHNPEKSTRDMLLFSLMAYLEVRQHDWQKQEERFTTSNGTITTWKYKSDATNLNECTKITDDDLYQMLKETDNIFAEVKPSLLIVHIPYLCLPPQSSIRIGESSITLRNPFYTITFFVPEPFLEMNMMLPGSHTADVPLLPNGKARFETRVLGLRVIRKTAGLMTQHRDFSKYEEWSKRVVDGARAWFETKTADESGPPWFGGDGVGDGAMFWTGIGGGQGQIWIKGSRIYHESPP